MGFLDRLAAGPSAALADSQDGLTVTVHGARGSLPGAGPSMERYGGQTSCVEATCGRQSIVLDAGSGLANVGRRGEALELDVFLTHLHFDHICGLPFANVLQRPDGRVRVWLSERFGDPAQVVSAPFQPPNFPIRLADMPGTFEWRSLEEGRPTPHGAFMVTALPLNHPDGATGFRVEAAGKAMAYVTDHEPGTAADENAVALMAKADLAFMDTTYTPEEMVDARGWGHGDWRSCGRLAAEAGVRRWGLFHHHHLRSDAELDREGARAAGEFDGAFVAAAGARIRL